MPSNLWLRSMPGAGGVRSSPCDGLAKVRRNESAMKTSKRHISRRRFLERGTLGTAAAVGLGGPAGATARAAVTAEENPWRYDADRLRRVDPSMIHYERVGGFPVGNPAPRRVVAGPDGEWIVAAGRSVLAFSGEGRLRVELRQADLVRCVRVNADRTWYVGFRDHVEVLDRKGERVARWPAVSGKPFLTGIAVSDQDVYVADSGNRVVYRCDRQGSIQVRLGEKNRDRQVPGLVLPSPFLDVEVGADGLVRINNPGRHRVETYTRDGDLELGWGRPGVALDAFCGCCNPVALGLLPDGRCVTAEKGLPRVKVHGVDGRLESVVAGPEAFAAVSSDERGVRGQDTVQDGLDVAVDGEGRVAVLDLVGATVQVFRRKHPSGGAV